MMRVHGRVDSSTVNGPGRRAVLWTQGCVGPGGAPMSCAVHCWNQTSHDPTGGQEMTTRSIVDWYASLKDIDGLTVSGGEPLFQAPALATLVTLIGCMFPKRSIGIFSGYSEKELEIAAFECAGNQTKGMKAWSWSVIKQRLDWAVLGRYNALKPSTGALTTSSNQQVRLYSGRYSLADFAPQSVEITIPADGLTSIATGFPTRGL